MDREAVREYAERSEAVLEASPQMDEANTKAAVLRDFLELLDWKIPENTQLEYSVEAFGQTYKVDYALVLEGTPVAFLEAKGVDTALTGDHEEQLSSYMTNENVTYGILANGKQYRFFQRRVDATNVDVQKVGDVDLRDLPDRLPVLKAYRKDAIETGESGKILGRINELRGARTTLENEKDDLAVELAELLADQVSDSISPMAETQAKEMIDRLTSNIDAEINADGENSVELHDGDDPTDPTGNRVVGTVQRSDIDGDDDATVAVFPTKESGVPFLQENNAWGFVRVGREFEYVAMYVTGNVGQIKYIAQVKDVVPPEEAELARAVDEYADGAKMAEDKQVVRFEPGTLFELADPIPLESKYPQGLRYTTLEAVRSAETTDDVL